MRRAYANVSPAWPGVFPRLSIGRCRPGAAPLLRGREPPAGSRLVLFFGAHGDGNGRFDGGARGAPHGVDEDAYDLGIELIGGAAFELGEGVLRRARFLVRALGSNRVVGVCDRDYARAVGNLIAFEAQRITGAVVEL